MFTLKIQGIKEEKKNGERKSMLAKANEAKARTENGQIVDNNKMIATVTKRNWLKSQYSGILWLNIWLGC